jgi:nitrogen fixation NifU-like protein
MDLRDLYQQIILDHNKSPRNFHKMENATNRVEGFNPLCGDHYTIYLDVEGEVIRDISFDGSGCAISKASASLMSSMLKGKTVAEAEDLFKKFHDIVTGQLDAEEHLIELGKLAAFSGVCDYPARVKCATLAWHTMHEGIAGGQDSVTTE